jgi:tRNA A-37 threonylcarbamoyl transferase component Bud32
VFNGKELLNNKQLNKMAQVRIKLKGQFYGKVGTIVKRVNQYSFGIEFPDIRGVHPFSHRNIEIVDAGVNIENHVAKQAKDKLQVLTEWMQSEIEHYDQFNTQTAFGYNLAMRTVKERIEAILNGKS